MRSNSSIATTVDSSREQGALPAYVLITPARNEAAFIELTIKSVIAQTVKPLKWAIVSDGSTDGTDDIVKKYAVEHDWIELVRLPEHEERHFAAKVKAFNSGYARVREMRFDIIGNLDADISFEPDYFGYLLDKFATVPELGVAGTPFVEGSFQYDYRFVSIEHVSGACQLFRRECFEAIGGYMPIEDGGVDWIAVTTARMSGWRTRTFTDRTCLHHKRMGTGTSTVLLSKFRYGKQDYYLGGHPLWEIFRSIYQMKMRPYFLGGLFLLSGYTWAFLKGVERPISQELVEFRRREQMRRLRSFLSATLGQERWKHK